MSKWPRRRHSRHHPRELNVGQLAPLHVFFPHPLRPMLSYEYEEDGIHDPSNAMDVDSDDLDDAQGDIDIDADGVVDYEQGIPQQCSSPFETQVASTSTRTVSADLTSSLDTH